MAFDANTGRSYETNTERTYRLKSENLWILQWFCRVGLTLSLFIFLDYFLPSAEFRERIIDSWHTYGGRQSARSTKIILESGQKFSIYPDQSNAFRAINKDGTVLVQISTIFGMVLNVVNEKAHCLNSCFIG